MSKPTFHDSLGRLVIARTSRHAGGTVVLPVERASLAIGVYSVRLEVDEVFQVPTLLTVTR